MTSGYLLTSNDLRVHEHLRQEAEAMVRLLLGSRVEAVPAVGFCWPSEELTLRGERLSKLVISLPAEPKRADLWKKVVVKYAPFALLQVAPSPDEIVATFEGIDVRGRRVLVNAGRGSEQAMSLKIALYYFCLAREQRSEEYLKKSAHQIAFHLTAGELERASLVERLQGEYYLKRFPMLRQVLLAKLEHTSINTVEVLPLVEKELQTIVEDYRPKMRFNWRMYLWYNFFFLRKKDTLFLLKNPDTMLITQLYTCLIHPEKWGEQKKMIARTVFPVMMY
jgi:hypothetical protein